MTLKEMAKKNYNRGLWTVEMLEALVEKGRLHQADCDEITRIKMEINGNGGGGVTPDCLFALSDGWLVALYGR